MEFSTGVKENGLCIFETNIHYTIYPVETMGSGISFGDNQTSFTSKHFDVDFFFQLKPHFQGYLLFSSANSCPNSSFIPLKKNTMYYRYYRLKRLCATIWNGLCTNVARDILGKIKGSRAYGASTQTFLFFHIKIHQWTLEVSRNK